VEVGVVEPEHDQLHRTDCHDLLLSPAADLIAADPPVPRIIRSG
jgi:hypothetical protein